MLIFGSRLYGKKHAVKGWADCDACGRYGKNTSFTARKWGHLYFIPLIPLGGRVRVVKQCGRCSKGRQFPEDNVAVLVADMRRITETAMAAILAEQDKFKHDGVDVPCAAYLANSVEMLYCLYDETCVNTVLDTLQQKGVAYPHHLIVGKSLEFQGRLQEAAQAYMRAAECKPTETFPLLSLATVQIKRKDSHGASLIYEKVVELSEDRLPTLQILLGIYASLKEFDKLSQTYEECFELAPELAQDKKSVKAYTKACRKAGRHPVV